MATYDTFAKLAEHPEWIAPKSDGRVFLGEPGGPEANKTAVEPGNAFSPGMGTFGVTWWLRFPQSNTFFATETAPMESLKWHYEGGYLPVVHCQTQVEGVSVHHSLFQDGSVADRSEAVCGRIELANRGLEGISVQLFIALRSLGPAGGRVRDLMVGQDGHSFRLPEREPSDNLGRDQWMRGVVDRHLPLLGFDRSPNAIGCGVGDPSPSAREGQVPAERTAKDSDGWCFGLARFDLTLQADSTWQVHFDCPQQTYGSLLNELPGTATLRPDQYESRKEVHLARWQDWLGKTELDVPDEEFRNAFFAGLQHMLTAMVGDQVRIAPLAYPLAWLRDGVFIMRCFDLAGLHEIARAVTEPCVRSDFFGGLGAEGDAPGEGIWVLVEHYRITRDKGWLERVYPAIRRKCEWLFRMRRAKGPIQPVVDGALRPRVNLHRAAGLVCVAAKDGIIMGAMDNGISYSLGWVNHWALCGLREAAYAARELGLIVDATVYEAEAAELKDALRTFSEATPEFWKWQRTVNSFLWPARAWEEDAEAAEPGFNAWWEANRGTLEDYKPEPFWLYFEFGQAHNALLLGQRERAWQVIEYRLRYQDCPGLYGYREGPRDGDAIAYSFESISLAGLLRGYQEHHGVTPHGWSGSELWLLQRAVLVEEWQDSLLLFAGVPSEWVKPGGRIAFRNFPTWYGHVSAELLVAADGRSATVTFSGVMDGTTIKVLLPGCTVEGTGAGSNTVSLQIDLARD